MLKLKKFFNPHFVNAQGDTFFLNDPVIIKRNNEEIKATVLEIRCFQGEVQVITIDENNALDNPSLGQIFKPESENPPPAPKRGKRTSFFPFNYKR